MSFKSGRRLTESATLMTWASLAVRMSGLLVVLPMVLRRFPPAEVAVWQLFTTIFTLVLMLDLGLAPSFTRFLAFARGGASVADMRSMQARQGGASPSHDPAAVDATLARLAGTLRWIYPRIALVAVTVFAVLGTVSLAPPVAATANPMKMWMAWGVVLLGSGGAFLGNAAAATLQGLDRVAAQRRVEVVTGAAQALASVLVVALGGDLLAVVLTYQVGALLTVMANRRLLAREAPDLAHAPAVADREVLRVLWPTAWRSGLGVIASQGVIQLSGLLYARLVTPAQLASYLLALRVVTVASQISQAPFYSKLPRLALLYAAGERHQLLALAQRGIRLSQWVLCIGLVLGTFILPPALQAIGSRTPFVSPGIWALLCLAFLVERFGAMHMQVYSLTNHILWHVANGVTGALMLALASAGFHVLGLAAFPAAMLAAYTVFYSAWSARLSSRHFGFNLLAFEWRAGMPAALFLAGALAARLVTAG